MPGYNEKYFHSIQIQGRMPTIPSEILTSTPIKSNKKLNII